MERFCGGVSWGARWFLDDTRPMGGSSFELCGDMVIGGGSDVGILEK